MSASDLCTIGELARVFKRVSDETRLRILNLLMERECCVCEVIEALEISQSRASRNLAALYDAGFLKRRNVGLWVVYSIDREGLKEHYADLVEVVRKALIRNETALQDRQRLRSFKRVGPGCALARIN